MGLPRAAGACNRDLTHVKTPLFDFELTQVERPPKGFRRPASRARGVRALAWEPRDPNRSSFHRLRPTIFSPVTADCSPRCWRRDASSGASGQGSSRPEPFETSLVSSFPKAILGPRGSEVTRGPTQKGSGARPSPLLHQEH